MSEEILFSILIPSIPSRFAMVQKLVEGLEAQIGDAPVEICVFTDNKKRSIGMKREALMQMCNGRFAAFCDDDDIVNPEYVPEIVAAIRFNPDADVIVFTQHCQLDGKKFSVRFGLEYPVPEQARLMYDGNFKDIARPPWHICPWNTKLAKKHHFDNTGMDEDWQWLQKLLPEAVTQTRIDKVLHTYRYDSALSEGDQTIAARAAKEKAEKEGTNPQGE